MTDPRNRLSGKINGNRAWSGNPPSSFLSGNGCVFYGRNEKDSTGALWYAVWSVAPSGAVTEHLRIGPNAGQGLLAVDASYLMLTIYRLAGDNQPAERIAVPGWVRWTHEQLGALG
jgi:hypothetical protein